MKKTTRVPLLAAALVVGALLSSATAQQHSDSAQQQYSAAVALQNQQMFDLAADEWQAFIKSHPRHELAQKAQYYLGICRFQQQQFDAAERAFAAVVDQGGRFKLMPSAYLNLGLSQFNQGSTKSKQRAVESLRTLLRKYSRAPESAEAMFYLAESHHALDERRDAIAVYERALRDHPDHPRRIELLYGLGTAATEEKRHHLARDAFGRIASAATKPKSDADQALVAEARIRLADLLLADGKATKAGQLLEQAAQQNGALADYALLRLGESKLLAKDYTAAAKQFEALVKKFPKSTHRSAAIVGAVKSRFLGGQFKEVVAAQSAHRRLSGTAALEVAHWICRAHLKLGDPSAAASVAESAVRKASTGEKANEWAARLTMDVADALFEQDRKLAPAERQYLKVVERYGKSAVAPEAAYMAALTAIRQEKYQQAVAHADQFRKQYARKDKRLNIEVIAIQAEALLQLGDHERSAELWRKLIRERPEEAAQADWPIRLAVCRQNADDHDGVVSALRRYQPDDRELRHEAALLYAAAQAKRGSGEMARRTLERMLAQSPTRDHRSRGQLLLANLLRKSGDTDRALRTLTAMTEDSGDSVSPAIHLEQADLLYESGHYEGAVASYGRVVDVAQRAGDQDVVAEGLIGLGWSQIETGAAEQADRTFRQVLADHDDHSLASDALYGRAVALQQLKRFREAIPQLKQFLDVSPDADAKIDAKYILGMCYAGAGQHELAVRTLSALVAAHPKYEAADQALYELAWSLDSLGRDDEANETFEALATLFPSSDLVGEAAFRSGEASYEAKNHKSAAKFYKLAAKRGDATIRENALHKLGWTYFRRDAFEEAARVFQQQVQTFAQGDRAADGRLMLAECAYQQADYQRALSAFEAGLAGTKEQRSLVELAMLHAGQSAGQLKQWSKSLQWLRRCVEQFPDSAYSQEALYEQARALQAMGKHGEAKAIFAQVADTNDHVLGARARFMQGELEFAEKDFPAAIRTFFKVAYGYGHPNSPEEFHPWQADAMFEAARCCESTKRVAAAEKLYRDLVKHFPNSDKANAARKKLPR